MDTSTQHGRKEDGAADLQLARAALKGEPRSIDRLMARLDFLPALVRARSRRLSSPLPPGELDDVIQDVLLALWRKLGDFNGSKPLEAWASGFASIELIKFIERSARRGARVRDVEDAAGLAAPAPEPRYDLERLRRALAQIDPGDRRIVTLKHFDGLTFAQIAPHVDLVLNTVKTRYYRSLDRLRVILDRPEGAARS